MSNLALRSQGKDLTEFNPPLLDLRFDTINRSTNGVHYSDCKGTLSGRVYVQNVGLSDDDKESKKFMADGFQLHSHALTRSDAVKTGNTKNLKFLYF